MMYISVIYIYLFIFFKVKFEDYDAAVAPLNVNEDHWALVVSFEYVAHIYMHY